MQPDCFAFGFEGEVVGKWLTSLWPVCWKAATFQLLQVFDHSGELNICYCCRIQHWLMWLMGQGEEWQQAVRSRYSKLPEVKCGINAAPKEQLSRHFITQTAGKVRIFTLGLQLALCLEVAFRQRLLAALGKDFLFTMLENWQNVCLVFFFLFFFINLILGKLQNAQLKYM